jgi:transporter family protein
MNNNHQLFLFSGLAIIMWGLWGFFGKLALEREMTPTTLFLAEVFMSAVFSIPILVMILRKQDAYLPHVSWNIFGLVSGAGLALGLLFYYMALEKGQVAIVVPLTAIYPIVSVILGYVILKEKPSTLQWIGVFLVVAGAVLLLSGPLDKVAQVGNGGDGTVANR